MQISDESVENGENPGEATIRFTLTKDDNSPFLESETVTVSYTGGVVAQTQHQGNGGLQLQVQDQFPNALPGLIDIVSQLTGQMAGTIQVVKPNQRPVIVLDAELTGISVSGGAACFGFRSWGSVRDEAPNDCSTLVDADYQCFDKDGVPTGSGYIGQRSSMGNGGEYYFADWVLYGPIAPGRCVVTFRARTRDSMDLESVWATKDVELMVPADPNPSGGD